MSKLSVLWDDYQIYKGIKIYPFLMCNYDLFEELISILLFKKNIIGNVELIKMSYLKFLISIIPYMADENGKQYVDVLNKLYDLLKYILKDQEFNIYIDEKEKIFINIKTDNNSIILNERDFDKIKEIIFVQNAIPIIDKRLHPDLQKELQENIKFMAKIQGQKEGTIEEQIISYKCKMRFESYKPIKKMTIYQFRKELSRLNLIIDYQIYKTAEMSGMVTFNKPIPHWLSHISDKPDYSGLIMSEQEFGAKMNEFSKENNRR